MHICNQDFCFSSRIADYQVEDQRKKDKGKVIHQKMAQKMYEWTLMMAQKIFHLN